LISCINVLIHDKVIKSSYVIYKRYSNIVVALIKSISCIISVGVHPKARLAGCAFKINDSIDLTEEVADNYHHCNDAHNSTKSGLIAIFSLILKSYWHAKAISFL